MSDTEEFSSCGLVFLQDFRNLVNDVSCDIGQGSSSLYAPRTPGRLRATGSRTERKQSDNSEEGHQDDNPGALLPLMVRERGLEPLRLAAQDPKSCVSANSTTLACAAHDMLPQPGRVCKAQAPTWKRFRPRQGQSQAVMRVYSCDACMPDRGDRRWQCDPTVWICR